MDGEYTSPVGESRPQSPRRIEAPWCGELRTSLEIASQIVLSGNLGDVFPISHAEGPKFAGLETALRVSLRRLGYVAVLVHDPITGLRLSGPRHVDIENRLTRGGLKIGDTANTPDAMRELIHRFAHFSDVPIALAVNYAGATLAGFGPDTDLVLIEATKSMRASLDRRRKGTKGKPLRNTLVWIDERGDSIPNWYVSSQAEIRSIAVDKPGLEIRHAFARTLASQHSDFETASADEIAGFVDRFALSCDGEALTTMRCISKLARRKGFGIDDLETAIRVYRTGQTRNHWNSDILRSRMENARAVLAERVKGQDHAIDKTLDVLVRSVTGLSGAQSSGGLTRPRGVLFFAGPTGVGKTELAKAVTELLFGDEGACHRFDMSEFMSEDSISRLIGKPPDRHGTAQIGALYRALSERPFSVFLFDEVEKAHPRILDAFLQILDEGRITDASGATGYFSEALIIFTSNIGMFGGARSMNMGMNILPSDPYDALDRKIQDAVEDHFRYDLQRPELINRLGQNVVAFDFIHPLSERAIFDATLARVCDRVRTEHGIDVTLHPRARSVLQEICTHEVFDGGRGIGNRVETHFVNPLARLIFAMPRRQSLHITGVTSEAGQTTLDLG